jgi:DNA-binding NarL/FixJ family response regulator
MEGKIRLWPEQEVRLPSLSRRELEVANALVTGKPTSAIADELHIAPSTVSGHLQRIYLKLGVHSRAELKEVLKRYPHVARSA